jgi:hypothetical protein
VQQRAEQLAHEKTWIAMWNSARREAAKRMAAEKAKHPTSYHDFFVNTAVPGTLLAHFGGVLCRRFASRTISDAEIEALLDACPPFRAACHSVVMSFYVHSLKTKHPTDPKPPGRNDLMMATLLPYCDRFVTTDPGQEARLREIATEMAIACDVLSYEKFSSGFIAVS